MRLVRGARLACSCPGLKSSLSSCPGGGSRPCWCIQAQPADGAGSGIRRSTVAHRRLCGAPGTALVPGRRPLASPRVSLHTVPRLAACSLKTAPGPGSSSTPCWRWCVSTKVETRSPTFSAVCGLICSQVAALSSA